MILTFGRYKDCDMSDSKQVPKWYLEKYLAVENDKNDKHDPEAFIIPEEIVAEAKRLLEEREHAGMKRLL